MYDGINKAIRKAPQGFGEPCRATDLIKVRVIKRGCRSLYDYLIQERLKNQLFKSDFYTLLENSGDWSIGQPLFLLRHMALMV